MSRFTNGLRRIISLGMACGSLAAQADSLPPNILRQLPQGYEVLTQNSGKLNDDDLTDYLVVMRKKNEEEIAQKTAQAPPRPLLIFIQNLDGSFKLARRNDNVVLRIDEGGQCDPFKEGTGMGGEGGQLAIKNGYFTVEHGVACGQHWIDFVTFRYDSKLQDWVFHKRVSQSWVLNTSNKPHAEALVSKGEHVEKGSRSKPVLFAVYESR